MAVISRNDVFKLQLIAVDVSDSSSKSKSMCVIGPMYADDNVIYEGRVRLGFHMLALLLV